MRGFEVEALVVAHDDGCPICTGWCTVCGGRLAAEWYGIRECEACGSRFTSAIEARTKGAERWAASANGGRSQRGRRRRARSHGLGG